MIPPHKKRRDEDDTLPPSRKERRSGRRGKDSTPNERTKENERLKSGRKEAERERREQSRTSKQAGLSRQGLSEPHSSSLSLARPLLLFVLLLVPRGVHTTAKRRRTRRTKVHSRPPPNQQETPSPRHKTAADGTGGGERERGGKRSHPCPKAEVTPLPPSSSAVRKDRTGAPLFLAVPLGPVRTRGDDEKGRPRRRRRREC